MWNNFNSNMNCGTVYICTPPILKINVTSINIIKFNQNNAVEMLINDSPYIHIFYIYILCLWMRWRFINLFAYIPPCINMKCWFSKLKVLAISSLHSYIQYIVMFYRMVLNGRKSLVYTQFNPIQNYLPAHTSHSIFIHLASINTRSQT